MNNTLAQQIRLRKRIGTSRLSNQAAIARGVEKTEKRLGADSYKRAALQAAWNPYDQTALLASLTRNGCLISRTVLISLLESALHSITKFASMDPELQTAYANAGYKTHVAKDIYCLFYEMGHAVLRWRTGILAYITSNKWMRAGYGKSVRDFFEREVDPLLLIDFAGQRVFTTATVDVNILIFRKSKSDMLTKSCTIEENCLNVLGEYVRQYAYHIPFRGSAPWVIASPIEDRIREKIEALGTPLGEWDLNIYYGIKTGYNDAFIVDGKTKDRLIAEDPRSAEIFKPILRGRDIKRYRADFADLWLLFIPWHFPLHNDSNIQGASILAENEFRVEYPAIYRHLLSYKKELANRNKAETGIRYEWYALQRCAATYYEEFEKEKIMYSEIVREQQFFHDTIGYFPEATSFIITGESLEFLISLLNSDLITWAFKKFYAGGGLGGSGFRYNKQFILNLPLMRLNDAEQNPFVRCVKSIHNIVNSHISKINKNTLDQITIEEQKINNLVKSLYGLTSEELAYLESEKLKMLGDLR